MKRSLPKGVYPVMMTAFHEDGSLDFQGVNHLINHYIKAGAPGLFACAMSAEVNQLDDPEKIALAEHIMQYVNGRVPVVAGALSAGSQTQQIDLARRISDTGADIVTVAVSQIADKNEDDQIWLHNMDSFLQEIPADVHGRMKQLHIEASEWMKNQ